jgi:PKD repeat protein
MKKIIYLSLIFPLIFISCSKEPTADFYIEVDKAKVGSEVFFHNTSDNAETFEWDFGDGYISPDKNPVHTYSLTGKYTVVLSAFSKKGKEAKAQMELDVVEPSLLVVEVLEYWDEYSVPDASVRLYPSINDWDNETKMIIEGYTDADGIVVFADIDPPGDQNNEKRCYVDVWEQDHDNYQLRAEDPGFVTTQIIVPEKIQWFVAWVDYVPHGKGEARGAREMVIKKLERKVAGKTYPGSYKGPTDYDYLLNKSVKKK